MAKSSRSTGWRKRLDFEVQKLKTLDLRLDDQNPRLHPDERGESQNKLIQTMLDRFAIHEIAESICSAGFLPLDPFIGYRDDNSVVILEGNRRLATLQLLLDPSKCPPRHKARWDDFRARISPEQRKAITELNVQVARDRSHGDVLAYIGFRHVNGVMEWDPQEKAAYVATLVDSHGWSYKQIADSIGSKERAVERLYVGHQLVEQALADKIDGAKEMRNQFGVLTRAMQTPKITEFLRISFPADPKRSRQPSKANPRDLEDFVRWTFGTEAHKPVLEDSRDLTRWGSILASSESIRYLRTAPEPRFDRAYAKSGGEREGLVESLMAAADRLEEAVPLVRQHSGASDVQKAVARCADLFVQIIYYFEKIQRDQGVTVKR